MRAVDLHRRLSRGNFMCRRRKALEDVGQATEQSCKMSFYSRFTSRSTLSTILIRFGLGKKSHTESMGLRWDDQIAVLLLPCLFSKRAIEIQCELCAATDMMTCVQ